MTEAISAVIDKHVRAVPDWPEPGVTFRDITPLLEDADGLRQTIEAFVEAARALGPVDKVIGIEARGFIFAPAVAVAVGAGFVPVRKGGKLPAARHTVTYELEYGSSTVEMHTDAISPGERVLVIDDVLATGGTMAAVDELVELAGGTIVGDLVLIELLALGGRAKLGDDRVVALLTY